MKILFDITYSYGTLISYRGVVPNWGGTKPEYWRSEDYSTKQEAEDAVLALYNKGDK